MSYTARTEYYCSVNTEKEYTSFRWSLPDFELLKEYYRNVLSSEFMITNTETKCHLEFSLCNAQPKFEVPTSPIILNSTMVPNQSSTFVSIPSFGRYDTYPSIISNGGRPPSAFSNGDVSKQNFVTITQPEDDTYVYVHFPLNAVFDKMKVIVSIIDASGAKIISVCQTNGSANRKMTFKLIEASKLFSPNTTSRYVHNDTLTILCEIINIKKQESVLTDTKKLVDHFSNYVLKNLQVFFKSKNFCDVTLAVGNTEFHGHKVILAANSPVFEAMFNTEMTEQIEKTVKIKDIDTVTFEAFLNYIYTGSVGNMEEIVEDLLVVADKYQVVSLRNLCETHIADHLCKENAVKYLLLAYLHNFDTLKTKALVFVRSCQQEIVDSNEFKKLCNYPDLVSEIFRKPS